MDEYRFVKNPWAWFRDVVARRFGPDPMKQQRQYFMPMPIKGIALTEQQTLELSAVWACIQVIATAIAQCHVDVVEDVGGGQHEFRPDDPVAWLLNMRPNPDMPAVNFIEGLMFQAVPFGNAYVEIVRDGAGRPAQLWPLESDRVYPRKDPKTWALYYEYHDQNDGQVYRLEQQDVFHIRGPGTLNGLMGENIVARAAKSLAVAYAQEKFAGAFFGNGANPGGVLEYAGQLTPERHKMLADDFAIQRSGPDNAHRPLILEDGMKWNGTSMEPGKAQLIEERQFSVEEIARWFGVPLHKIQHLLHATFSNIEHQSIEFVRDCLTPWKVRIEQEGSYKLFNQRRSPWRRLCIDVEPLKEGDAKTKAEGLAIARTNGVISTNEWRMKVGMNPKPGKENDALIVQMNMTTLKAIVDPPKPVQQALPPGADQPQPDTNQSGNDAGQSYAAEALRLVFTSSLGRYATRMSARRADLSKHCTATQVTQSLDDERERLRLNMLAELAPTARIAVRAIGRGLTLDDVIAATALVELGSPPLEAVAQSLPAVCPPVA